jgi:hypothetical protein
MKTGYRSTLDGVQGVHASREGCVKAGEGEGGQTGEASEREG